MNATQRVKVINTRSNQTNNKEQLKHSDLWHVSAFIMKPAILIQHFQNQININVSFYYNINVLPNAFPILVRILVK